MLRIGDHINKKVLRYNVATKEDKDQRKYGYITKDLHKGMNLNIMADRNICRSNTSVPTLYRDKSKLMI